MTEGLLRALQRPAVRELRSSYRVLSDSLNMRRV